MLQQPPRELEVTKQTEVYPRAQPKAPPEIPTLGKLGWLRTKPPDRPALIMHEKAGKTVTFMPQSVVGMLVAAGGAGKTQAIVQLALAVATGGRWLGLKSPLVVPECRSVLVLAGEEVNEELHRRFYWCARNEEMDNDCITDAERSLVAYGLQGQDVRLLARPEGMGDLISTTYHTEVLARLAEPPPGAPPWGLVIVDPCARFMPPDAEKDSADGTRFINALEELGATRDRPSVLAVHHTNKISRDQGSTTSSASRGTTALTDGARWVANLDKGDKECDAVLRLTKSNYTAMFPAIRIGRETGGVLRALGEGEASQSAMDRLAGGSSEKPGSTRDLKDVLLKHIKAASAPIGVTALREIVGKKKESVMEALEALEAGGDVVRDVTGRYPGYVPRGWTSPQRDFRVARTGEKPED